MVQSLGRQIGSFFTKLNILLPYHPATVLLSIYPNKLKTSYTENLHMDLYSSFTHN